MPSSPPPPEPPSARSTAGVSSAWVVLLTIAGLTTVRILRGDAAWLLIVWGAYTPFVLLPAYLTLAFGLARGQRALALLSLVVVGAHLVAVVPQALFRSAADARLQSTLRVASLNGNGWNTDPLPSLRALARFEPDMVCLQEVSPAWAEALRDEGWMDDYPHRHMVVREGVWGMALLSRYPLGDLQARDLNEAPAIEADVEHAGRTLRVFCVHPAPPAGDLVDSHQDALTQILGWAAEHRDDSAILLGDFNSTPYSEFSRAMREHTDDAWELAGRRSLGHTWPQNGMLYPPARLDHIFVTRSLGVSRAEVGVAGLSDHAPVIADIVLRAR